jgi:hypothetical protein
MHNAALLASENEGLRTANEHQKRKQTKQRSYIATESTLTVEEGVRRVEKRDRAANAGNEEGPSEVKTRAPRRCSKCGSCDHTARTCQQ